MIDGIEEVAFLAGIIMGCILLLAVSWVWIRKQVLGSGGIIMSFVGLALVGLVVWSSIRIEASPEGIIAQFERELEQIEQMVNAVDEQVARVDSGLQDVVTANISFSESIESLADSVENNNRQFMALTADLESSRAIESTQVQRINDNIATPQIERDVLLRQRESLEAIRRNR